MKSELVTVAVTWAIGAGVGQCLMWPFGMANGALWFGLVFGATTQAAVCFGCKRTQSAPTVRGER